MLIEHQELLFNKYPSLFIQKNLPKSETCMCWGIETGPGWYDLIDETCAKIIKIDKDKEVQFTQIKEKFGGLRIYFNIYPSNKNIEYNKLFRNVLDIINKSEIRSFSICENCGKPGKRVSINNWLLTLCKTCINKLNKDK